MTDAPPEPWLNGRESAITTILGGICVLLAAGVIGLAILGVQTRSDLGESQEARRAACEGRIDGLYRLAVTTALADLADVNPALTSRLRTDLDHLLGLAEIDDRTGSIDCERVAP